MACSIWGISVASIVNFPVPPRVSQYFTCQQWFLSRLCLLIGNIMTLIVHSDSWFYCLLTDCDAAVWGSCWNFKLFPFVSDIFYNLSPHKQHWTEASGLLPHDIQHQWGRYWANSEMSPQNGSELMFRRLSMVKSSHMSVRSALQQWCFWSLPACYTRTNTPDFKSATAEWRRRLTHTNTEIHLSLLAIIRYQPIRVVHFLHNDTNK